MWACKGGLEELAQHLLKRGAKINLQANDGTTALMWACKDGPYKLVQHLLSRGAKIDLQTSEGKTALMLACKRGSIKVAQDLLKRGAKINLQANDGATALMWACKGGPEELVQHLLRRGAKINLQANDGTTALMWAWKGGPEELVQHLLKRGAKINLQANDGTTALMLLCSRRPSTSKSVQRVCCTAKLFLGRGASLNFQDKRGRRALDFASNKVLATLLAPSGAQVDFSHIPSARAQAVLTIAWRNGYAEVLELFSDLFCSELFRSPPQSTDPAKRARQASSSAADEPKSKCSKTT